MLAGICITIGSILVVMTKRSFVDITPFLEVSWKKHGYLVL